MSYSRDPIIPGLKHTPSVPYKSNATRLQTLDIWLPDSPPPTTSSTKPTWIIYVHGGAWRDPTQDSLCFVPTLQHLTKTYPDLLSSGSIAGIASLNYRLSPYPSHTTDPSTPEDGDRNVQHPEHVRDVYSALEYLVKEYDIKSWVGIGHSCGATLLLSLPLVSPASSAVQETAKGLVLLAGIYDFPSFLANHSAPAVPENIATVYKIIVESAFGTSSQDYEVASPTKLAANHLWTNYVVLGYSPEDDLVEPQQREEMLEAYLKAGWVKSEDPKADAKVVRVKDLTMGHYGVWEDGRQIAELIKEVVSKI